MPRTARPRGGSPRVAPALQRSDSEVDTDPGADPGDRATDWELAIVPAPPSLELPIDPEDLVGILLVVEADGGPIRLAHPLRRRDRLDRLLNQAALDPAPGAEPAWPRRIRVVDPDLARALEGAEASVVVVDALPTLDGLARERLLAPERTGDGASDDLTSDAPMPELIDADHLLRVDAGGEPPCLTFQLRRRDAEHLVKRLEAVQSLLVVGDASGGVHVIACSTTAAPRIALLTFVEPSASAATLARHANGEAPLLRVRVADGGVARPKPVPRCLYEALLPASAPSR